MATAAVEPPSSAEQVFDNIGPAYEDAFAGLATQAASINWLLDALKETKPAKCLDIGCGTGRPVCSSLSAASHDVLGIDVSGAMIDDARRKVPDAKFDKISVVEYKPDAASFDAITAYFSMIAETTPEQIRRNIENVYSWLRPGGLFVFSTVPLAAENLAIKWMGQPVVVSSLEAEEAVNWIQKVGFEIVHHGVSVFTPKGAEAGICAKEDVWEEPHLFVYARKPQDS